MSPRHAFAAILALACHANGSSWGIAESTRPALPAERSQTDGVVKLFDGQTFAGWKSDRGTTIGANWEVVDDTIHCRRNKGGRGHLLSVDEYDNFDFRFEWKIARGGNSGVKYRVSRFDVNAGGVLPAGRWILGQEYQLLDDPHHGNGRNPRTSLGAIYGLYPPIENKPILAAGQWNTSRVVANGPHIEHWLNGELVCKCEIGSDDWRRRVERSKYAQAVGFGENHAGRLMLQDHGAETWFRNLELRHLGAQPAVNID